MVPQRLRRHTRPRARRLHSAIARETGERTDRAGPKGFDHRLPEAGVLRRIEHGETAHRTLRRGLGCAVVVVEQSITVEHGTFNDGEALPVGQDLPHVVEAR